MNFSKVTVTPIVTIIEAQAGRRDRLYFTAGNAAAKAKESSVEIVKEGRPEKYSPLEISVANSESLSEDSILYVALIEVDGVKDDSAMVPLLEKAAAMGKTLVSKEVTAAIEENVENEMVEKALLKLAAVVIKKVIELFKKAFKDDFVGATAFILDGKDRVETKVYKSDPEVRLDFEYSVSYDIKFV